jgi:serine/threonine protein kinase
MPEKEEINLIKHILRVNPSKRPQVTQILEHPYFEPEKLNIEKNSS